MIGTGKVEVMKLIKIANEAKIINKEVYDITLKPLAIIKIK